MEMVEVSTHGDVLSCVIGGASLGPIKIMDIIECISVEIAESIQQTSNECL